MYKIIYGIVSTVIHELVDEFFRAYIKHHFIRVISLHVVADGLRKMSFTQAHTAIDHQWIERVRPGFISNGFTRAAGHPVTIALYECIKGINRIQLRVDLHFLETRNNKRILYRITYN